MQKKMSGWIWSAQEINEKETEAVFVYFRKKVFFQSVPDSFRIKISADSRYKLFINGVFCGSGPAKGNDKVHFFDEIETSPYLKEGENLWTVMVMHYSSNREIGNHSMFRTETPGFYLESEKIDEATGIAVLKSDASWEACNMPGIQIASENPFFAPLKIYENVDASKNLWDWKTAVEYKEAEISECLKKENLSARDIPLMKICKHNFKGISKIVNSLESEENWEEFKKGKRTINISENYEACVEIDAGELMTGYLSLAICGGTDAEIEILQSEGYVVSAPKQPKNFDDKPVKGDRSDALNGVLAGYTDTYKVCGNGTEDQPEIYEPFWFRTFRYIRLKIKTKAEPLQLRKFSYEETGYPLEIQTHVETSDAVLQEIWDISERTLRRCMHDTYMDCPFYEQLQYVMDSRNQILYTYATAADDRLARRCMMDMRDSQRSDGLLNSCYPNVCENVIPGFSIYYIGMVYDHMMYFGDKKLVKEHLPAIQKILEYFREHSDERGIVKKIGDLNRPGNYWSFIDWTPEWNETNGVPSVTLSGPITMESFLYLLGLQYAEKLCVYISDENTASEYHMQAENLKQALNTWCRGKDGMYQDGPGIDVYSQHCQVFAVLTETVSAAEGKEYLLETLEHKEDYAQCSVAMMYYLFRALEACGAYEKTEALWESWKIMLRNHMTTCAEDPIQSRSDCHAWGALALYELPSVILGVRPVAPGYEKVEIKPHMEYLSYAKGSVITPKGKIRVEWKKENDGSKIEIDVPQGLNVIQ